MLWFWVFLHSPKKKNSCFEKTKKKKNKRAREKNMIETTVMMKILIQNISNPQRQKIFNIVPVLEEKEKTKFSPNK